LSTARISKSKCAVKLEPCEQSETSSEALFGESVLILEQKSDWFRIRTVRDGYEGYIDSSVLDHNDCESTHWVSTRATQVFQKPDIKSSVAQRVLFGSELSVSQSGAEGNFLQLIGGGFVWSAHCLKQNAWLHSSMIEIAQSNYRHTPYLWGGRSSDGCDCSGLVQMLAMARGINLPRDSIDQENALTRDIEFNSRAAEDLVFWPGHVGILQSPEILLHATAHSMRCCVEPLSDVIQRAGTPSSIKRVS